MTDQPTPSSGSRWEPPPAPAGSTPAPVTEPLVTPPAGGTAEFPAAAPSEPAALAAGRSGHRPGRLRSRLAHRPRGRVALGGAAAALALVSGLGGFALGLAADGQDAGTQVATSGATTDDGAGSGGLPGQPPDFGGGRGGGMPPGPGGGYDPGTLPDGTLPDGTGDGATGNGTTGDGTTGDGTTTDGTDPGSVTGDPA